MTELEVRAWERYCSDTAGDIDVRDFWCELSPAMQAHWINKVTYEN